MPILAAVAEDVDRLSEQERQRLYSLAAVRGYRIQSNRHGGTHCVVLLRRMQQPERCSDSYHSKKEARRALLRLMLTETRRRAA